nr:short chain dehydrogenase [uncultured bacterium]
MGKLSGKVIWITGASSGIGEALAYALAKKGSKLILSSRRKEELERVKGNCLASAQPNIRILALDLTESSMMNLSVQAAIQFFGRVDILINNGGISQRSLVKETSVEVDRKLMEVNYFGTVALTKHLLPYFIKQKAGHYVNVSSVTGKFGTPYRSGYAASKHALHGFFDSLRAEHYADNIKVTMICPGFIQTNLALSAVTGNGTPLRKPDPGKHKRRPCKLVCRKNYNCNRKRKARSLYRWERSFCSLSEKIFSELVLQINS